VRLYGAAGDRRSIFRMCLVGFAVLPVLPVLVLSVFLGTVVLVAVVFAVGVLAFRMGGDGVRGGIVTCNEIVRGRVARHKWHGHRESRGGCDDGDDKGGLETHVVHKSVVLERRKKKLGRKKK
jgi:hypothetical protein